jgi:cytidylate kinase
MNTSLESCLSFLNGQVRPGTESERVVSRAVTISRQAGCGAQAVAEKAAEYLQKQMPINAVPWTVFDRGLIDKVLEDHSLPAYLAKFLPEDRISAVEDALAELFGVRPPVQKIVEQTADTMLKLAELGNVILIGRGGNVVTAKIPRVLHVRLVAPLEDRIERICRADNRTPDEARIFCLEEERARARYLKTYFNADVSDPLRYHLVLNTGLLGCDAAAQIIASAVMKLQ